jgi:hypothetical protein
LGFASSIISFALTLLVVSFVRKKNYGFEISRDAPHIRPAGYPAFFDIRYPVGYQIALPDIR